MEMKNVIYACLDIAESAALGGLLVYLMKGMLPERFVWKGKIHASFFFWLQFVAAREFLSYSNLVKRLIYGEGMQIASSRQSIAPVLASLCITLLAGFLLYRGSRIKAVSLVAAFYAFLELIRFFMYPFAVWCIGRWVDWYTERNFVAENGDLALYYAGIERVELFWNVSHACLAFAGVLTCVFLYKRALASGGTAYRPEEAAVLCVPELMGLSFTVMLRSILFYYEKEVYNLVDHYPELNGMIPCVAFLCIASILLNVKMLGKVEREHEKRRRAELCQSRAEELYAHVKDLESVNLKIRGMKHDLKHYTADIQALLLKIESGDMWAKEELRHYVDSMHLSLERLDSKCQTNHPVTDVIIGRYERLMEQKQISFSCDFIYPKQFGIDVFDLSVILNNGLENALEAFEREPGKAKASILSKQKGNMFFITIENTCSKRMRWGEEFPISEKRENGHGLGLKNIKDCAERYFGRVCVQILDNRFILTVMLQGQSVP